MLVAIPGQRVRSEAFVELVLASVRYATVTDIPGARAAVAVAVQRANRGGDDPADHHHVASPWCTGTTPTEKGVRMFRHDPTDRCDPSAAARRPPARLMACIRRHAAGIVVAGTTLAGAGGIVTASPAHAQEGSMTVVAVGDSYASGEGAIGAGWVIPDCHRSAIAGPENAAGRLNGLRRTRFHSFACSGAATANLLGSEGQLSKIPTGRVDALSMSIGGNDLDFVGIVLVCMIPFQDCMGLEHAVTASLAALPGKLAAVFDAVPLNVANVFVTEYPDPTTGMLGIPCGDSLMPGFQGWEDISLGESVWASIRVIGRLNAALATAVAAANARPGPHPIFRFVTGISARFATHGFCTGGGSNSPLTPATWFHPRYINTPVDSFTSQGNHKGSMHPNDLGQQAIGEALFDAMRFLTVGNIEVPDVVGADAVTARKTLVAARFVVDQRSWVDRTCNEIGVVVSQFPHGGSKRVVGDTVISRSDLVRGHRVLDSSAESSHSVVPRTCRWGSWRQG